MTIWKYIFIHLWFNINFLNTWNLLKLTNLNLIVKMTDITDNCLILHFFHMLCSYYITIPCCSHINISFIKCIFNWFYLIAFHHCLQCTDWINLIYYYSRTKSFHRLAAAFTDIAITTDNNCFSCNHHISCSFYSISKALPASIQIIKF